MAGRRTVTAPGRGRSAPGQTGVRTGRRERHRRRPDQDEPGRHQRPWAQPVHEPPDQAAVPADVIEEIVDGVALPVLVRGRAAPGPA